MFRRHVHKLCPSPKTLGFCYVTVHCSACFWLRKKQQITLDSCAASPVSTAMLLIDSWPDNSIQPPPACCQSGLPSWGYWQSCQPAWDVSVKAPPHVCRLGNIIFFFLSLCSSSCFFLHLSSDKKCDQHLCCVNALFYPMIIMMVTVIIIVI